MGKHDLDDKRCVLVEFTHDQSVEVGFRCWLHKDYSDSELIKVKNEKDTIMCYWPVSADNKTVEIKPARKMLRFITDHDIPLNDFAIYVHDFGDWKTMQEELKSLLAHDTADFDASTRKLRKKKVNDDYVTIAKSPSKRRSDKSDTSPKPPKSARIAAKNLHNVANKALHVRQLEMDEKESKEKDCTLEDIYHLDTDDDPLIAELKKEKEDLHKKLTLANKTVQKLTEENKTVEKLTEENKNLVLENKKQENIITELNRELEKAKNDLIEQLDSSVADDMLKKSYAVLKTGYQKLDDAVQELEEENKQHKITQETLECEANSLKLDLKRLQGDIEKEKSLLCSYKNLVSKELQKTIKILVHDYNSNVEENHSNDAAVCMKSEESFNGNDLLYQSEPQKKIKSENAGTNKWPITSTGSSSTNFNWKTHNKKKQVSKDEYLLGSKYKVSLSALNGIRSKSSGDIKTFTKALMDMIFTPAEIATHSLTGQTANSRKGTAAKDKLDPLRVQAILNEVQDVHGHSKANESLARHAITRKCNVKKKE